MKSVPQTIDSTVVRYSTCARCKAPDVPLTRFLLDVVEYLNSIRRQQGSTLPTDEEIALCDACHVERRRFLDERGKKTHDREQALWEAFRAGDITEEQLLDGCKDKSGMKALIERRKEHLKNLKSRKGRNRRDDSDAFGGGE